MARGFYNYPTKAPFYIPCHCGSREVYWHGPETAIRVYCCESCWELAAENVKSKRLSGHEKREPK
jgi:hypothetical protein